MGFTFCFSKGVFSWDVNFKQDEYDLKMTSVYPHGVTLAQVKEDLKNFDLLSKVSGPIASGISSGSDNEYEQVLTLKTYGIPSKLFSKCKEEYSNKFFKRRCDLDVTQGGGKKSMVWKFDEVICQENYQMECKFSIKGKTKDLKILGFTLMGKRELAVKGKYEAIKNFAKIWFYRNLRGVHIEQALKLFENNKLHQPFENFYKNAQEILEKNPKSFIYSNSGNISY